MNIRRIVGILFIAVLFVGLSVAPAHAQESDDTQSLAEQVAELLARVAELQDRLAELQDEQRDVQDGISDVLEITRDLSRGMSGDDVQELQELLATDPTLYPEGLVTGYYGSLTEAAVLRLQERFGIDRVGRVGPITRGMLNRLFKKETGERGSFLRTVTVDEDDDDTDLEDVDFSEFAPGTTGVLLCHTPPGNRDAQKTIAVGGPAVQAHLGHGDELGRCDGEEADDDDDDDEGDDEDDEDSDEDEDEDRDNAADAISEAEDAIESAEDAIQDAQDNDEDTQEAEGLLEDAEEKLDDARDAFDDENYDDAEDLADDAKDLAEEAQDVLE